MIEHVVSTASVPVIETGVGNCHVYVDEAADLAMAEAIVLNAKTSRPSVCNSAETLLVHLRVADRFVPQIVAALHAAGVVIHGDTDVVRLAAEVLPATDEDWATDISASTWQFESWTPCRRPLSTSPAGGRAKQRP